ncbi:MAG: UDP-N-acetylmuramoyl-L-alanine--D-glutamate ligase [Patescibacteria group bacterium]
MKGDPKEKFSGKKVAVLGLGVDAGLEAASFLLEEGAIPTVFDEKEEALLDAETIKKCRSLDIPVVFGKFENFDGFDFIFRSPGVHSGAAYLKATREKGIEITSSTKIFFEYAEGLTIGVTGTKGKGTTASLIAEMLRSEGKDVYLGGNIGVSMLSLLPKLTAQSVSVCELSSFQLIDLTKSPNIAVVLMVTSEHLDYHVTEEEYVEAKGAIAKFQSTNDVIIANQDFKNSIFIANQSFGKKYWVSRNDEVREGCFVRDNSVFVRNDAEEEKIVDTNEIFLPGSHNLENVCAATMAAKCAGVSTRVIAATLRSFRGLPHRLELIAEIDGVRYVNDSFSTTPESAIAAIKAFNYPKIMILGGSHKGSDFGELGELIQNDASVKAVIGIGEEWERIKEAIDRTKKREVKFIEGCKSMAEIVDVARKEAVAGDIVMLSPACASFGMFKSYKDRGDQFKREVLGSLFST